MSDAASSRKAALIGRAIMAGAVLGIVAAERLRPRRVATQPTTSRIARNALMGALSIAVVALVERPVVERVIARNPPRQSLLRRTATFLAMDYTIYLWHVLTHKAPPLWRFHRVHHIDRDMDMTTALRFHAGDMLVSIPWRAAQVALFRVDAPTFALWQRFFLLSILFHHANIRLGPRAEQSLSWLLTTPGMHDTHHRATRDRTDSNWSSGLAIWDHLHRTFRRPEIDPTVPLGVPAYAAEEARIEPSLRLPLKPIGDDWMSGK